MRLRVLPLPHSADPNDQSTPFVLVFDEVEPLPSTVLADLDQASIRDATGARGLLVFPGSVDLPDVDPTD